MRTMILSVLAATLLLPGLAVAKAPSKPIYAGVFTSRHDNWLKKGQQSVQLFTTNGYQLCKLPKSGSGSIVPMKGKPVGNTIVYTRCTAGQYVTKQPNGQLGNFFNILRAGQAPPAPDYN